MICSQVCAFTNDGLRFRNLFNVRIQNIILFIFKCQKTCGLRLHKPPILLLLGVAAHNVFQAMILSFGWVIYIVSQKW